MTLSEFDIGLATRGGRPVKEAVVEYVRDLTPADIALLGTSRGVKPPNVLRLRDRHHAVARYLTMGKTVGEVSILTGLGVSRIQMLKGDPSFQELLAEYRQVDLAVTAEFHDRATTLALTAMDSIQDQLEENPEAIPITTRLEIAKTFADRTGHAPVQRSETKHDVRIGIAAQIETGRQRALEAKRLMIEGPKPDGS